MGDPSGIKAPAIAAASAMADRPDRADLTDAANTLGVAAEYWDVWHKRHEPSRAAVEAILASLGLDPGQRASLHAGLQERTWRTWRQPLPPTLVFTTASRQEAPVSVPESLSAGAATLEIRLEGGGEIQSSVDLSAIPMIEEYTFGGARFVRKRVRLPEGLPPGYHELTIRIAGEAAAPSRLIIGPERAYQPEWLESGRCAGIAISLFGVRSERNWGCGDTTDLSEAIDWAAAEAGASFLALNPLHAIPNRQPYNTSPYLPNSIFYRNPIYLDIEKIEDFRKSPRAQALLRSVPVQKELAALRDSEFVEYERVYRLKLAFLKLLFATFLRNRARDVDRTRAFNDYVDGEGELLHRFAVHAALDDAIHKQSPDVWTWRSWPERFQDPESPETQEFTVRHWRSILFHKYMQWELDRQFEGCQKHARARGMRIGLYHDLALATDRFGADLWAHRDFFIAGCRVGAPPDAFSPKGQDWAFPPPDSQRHYEDGYRLFTESIRRNIRHGGALRIDHVMRFFRLYWIPEGMDATQGTYVADRFEDLLTILALESVRQKVVVIGEDLGTVPDEVRSVLHRFGILSYKLLYFERTPDGRFLEPSRYPKDALVSVTTHDLPTLAGFWLGRDIEQRRDANLLPDHEAYLRMIGERMRDKQQLLDLLVEQGMLPSWFPRDASAVPELTGELHNAIVGLLASTPCKFMLLNQEDLLKETEQQNLPASTTEYPNWRRKMKCTTEELWTSAEVRAFVRMFHGWLERSGRLPAATT